MVRWILLSAGLVSCTVYDDAALSRVRTTRTQRAAVSESSSTKGAPRDAASADSSSIEMDAAHGDIQTGYKDAGDAPAADSGSAESTADAAAALPDTGTRPDAEVDAAVSVDAGAPDAETETESGFCAACNSTAPAQPVLSESGGSGNVTTYGSLSPSARSTGGACNYGTTEISHYAAINVDVEPGDAKGQWQGGRICGQCAAVRVKTPDGWKETVVRIVDKCGDPSCGIALGGAAARELMGEMPGRYDGRWRFVSCEDHAEASDGPPTLRIKEGSSTWWSLLHVRNPKQAVTAIDWQSTADPNTRGSLAYATEAENFYSVPQAIHSNGTVRLTIHYRDETQTNVELPTRQLGESGAEIALP